MKDCEKYQELISASIDNELSNEEKAELAEHLRSCSECAALYRAFEALSSSLSDELEDMPAELHENIMAEIRRGDIEKKNKKLSKPLKTIIASAACAAFIIGAAFIASPRGAEAPAVLSLSPLENSSGEAAVASESYSPDYDEVSEITAEPAPGREEASSKAAAGKSAPNGLQAESPAMMFSAAPDCAAPESSALYELEREEWEAFLSLISDGAIGCDETPVENADVKVSMIGAENSAYIELFYAEDGLIYYDSSDGFFYSSPSDAAEVDAFLNIS